MLDAGAVVSIGAIDFFVGLRVVVPDVPVSIVFCPDSVF
jgi:hypothetical protein